MGMYDNVRALRPGRSAFNLSYDKKLTCDMGQLIPVLCEEAIPGDTWKIGIEAVVRFMPMVAPILHEINLYVHYYFVPYRLCDSNWEGFITGGEDGQNAATLPLWTPTGGNVTDDNGSVHADNGVGSLWDYFGFPTGIIPTTALPIAYCKRAYNLVYNQYYRDEQQRTALGLDSNLVLQRAWEKDYFTSALPWQQRGIAPALPISGSSAAVWPVGIFSAGPPANGQNVLAEGTTPGTGLIYTGGAQGATNVRAAFNANTVNLGAATTFNVADLRLAFSIQKWMERNARGGARYTEFLLNHFGVAPRDERLQRAEYIGGTRMPVIVSEVLQTSSTDGTSPQANMAGHGLAAGRDFCASYRCEEFGVIIGIMSVMPRSAYQQGVNRQWLRRTRYDFYSPEFAHLSEQAVTRGELYVSNAAGSDDTIFGYQGRYNEMRSKSGMVCGLMRYGVAGSLGYWNLARNFAAAPSLNLSFMMCVPRKDFLAAPSQPTCIVNIANIVKAVRPLPVESDPGLLDHS